MTLNNESVDLVRHHKSMLLNTIQYMYSTQSETKVDIYSTIITRQAVECYIVQVARSGSVIFAFLVLLCIIDSIENHTINEHALPRGCS